VYCVASAAFLQDDGRHWAAGGSGSMDRSENRSEDMEHKTNKVRATKGAAMVVAMSTRQPAVSVKEPRTLLV